MSEDLKNASQDTTPAVETEEAQGTVDVNTEDTNQVAPALETEPKNEMVSKDEVERLLKEKDQVEKRKNQLEKLLEKASAANDTSAYDVIIEELKAENEAYKAEKEAEQYQATVQGFEKEMTDVFEKKLESYPEAVQKAARFNKNKFGVLSIVGDAQYSYQAEKNIEGFLDELSKEVVEPPKPEIKVDAGNFPVLPEEPQELEIAEGVNNMAGSEHDFLKNMADGDFKDLYRIE